MDDIGLLLAFAAACILIGIALLTTERWKPTPGDDEPYARHLDPKPENPEDEARRRQI